MKTIVLASSSPRRVKLLEEAGIPFIIDPSHYDESLVITEIPTNLVETLSKRKAEEVSRRHPQSIIIGADTTVVINDRIIGKPSDKKDAKRMLQMLNGKSHKVITGFTIIDTESGKTITSSVESAVYFKTLTEKQIDEYLETKEPYDKAGAYAIQEGLSQYFIEKFEGEYENIVGLPITKIKALLREFGINL